jgi:hypothetical protein
VGANSFVTFFIYFTERCWLIEGKEMSSSRNKMDVETILHSSSPFVAFPSFANAVQFPGESGLTQP